VELSHFRAVHTLVQTSDRRGSLGCHSRVSAKIRDMAHAIKRVIVDFEATSDATSIHATLIFHARPIAIGVGDTEASAFRNLIVKLQGMPQSDDDDLLSVVQTLIAMSKDWAP